MRVRVKIGKNTITFTSELAKHRFFERNSGKDGFLESDDNPSENMRRYFEGAIIPAVFYQHPHSGWEDFGAAREALKLEFLPGYTQDLEGNRVKYPRSTTTLSKERFVAFMESVSHLLIENGLEAPDAEDYKAWRDSAPDAEEIYPPLARMRESYIRAKMR